MEHDARETASAASDNPDPTPPPPEPSSRTVDDASTQSFSGPAEYNPSRIPREVAELMDPDLLGRYYQALADAQTRRVNYELEQLARGEGDRSRQGVPHGPPKEASVSTASSIRSGKPPTYWAKDEKE